MLQELSSLAKQNIAQTALYGLVTPICIYQFIRKWSKRPWEPWVAPILFTSMRLADGIIGIVGELEVISRATAIGLIVADAILWNAATMFVAITVVSLLLFPLLDDPQVSAISIYGVLVIKIVSSVGLALLTSGSAYCSYYSAKGFQSSITIRNFVTVGYCFFAVVSALAVVVLMSIWARRDSPFVKQHNRLLQACAWQCVFLILRAIYSLVMAFTDESIWGDTRGYLVAWSIMVLASEYIIIWLQIWVLGLVIPRRLEVQSHLNAEPVWDGGSPEVQN